MNWKQPFSHSVLSYRPSVLRGIVHYPSKFKCVDSLFSHLLMEFLSHSEIKDLFPSFVRVPATGSATPVLNQDGSNFVTCGLRMRSSNNFDWWELTQLEPKPLFDPEDSVLEMITFNDLVPPLHFSFFTSTG